MTADTFDFRPVLSGTRVTARPLVAGDFDALADAASDPAIWDLHPDPERWRREVFRRNVFDGALESGSAFTITDSSTGSVIGTTRYYQWDAALREVAIGYTFLRRSHWGNGSNDELKRMMLVHAFRWADRVWFHVGEENLRSRRAVEKLGARLDSVRELPASVVPVLHAYYCLDRHDYAQAR